VNTILAPLLAVALCISFTSLTAADPVGGPPLPGSGVRSGTVGGPPVPRPGSNGNRPDFARPYTQTGPQIERDRSVPLPNSGQALCGPGEVVRSDGTCVH
jgi:hypothetical protein